MTDSKSPDDRRRGDKSKGKYHYNPGNQSGKEAEILEPGPDHEQGRDRTREDDKQRNG